MSHELVEVMTDPLNPPRAWDDETGHEIADMCAGSYGRSLGSTSAEDPTGTEYNQIIHGGRYYLPEAFSNLAYAKFGPDRGCVLSETIARSPTAAATGVHTASPETFLVDATPTALAADGKATSTVDVAASDSAGNGLSGDHVHFSVAAQTGTGQCGTLSSTDQPTGKDGRTHVTYTASKADAACWVIADEAEDGRSAQALIYQGPTRRESPILRASFPAALQAGGGPTAFTLSVTNPSSKSVPETLDHFVVLPGNTTAAAVTASQVHLSYSTKGRNGAFVPVPLVGSTRAGNAIEGSIGPLRGATLPPHSSETLTLRVTLSGNVPVSKTRPLLAFQAYLAQTDPASGSDASLADTGMTRITVPTAAQSHTLRNVAFAVVGALVLVSVPGLLVWRAHNKRRARRSPV